MKAYKIRNKDTGLFYTKSSVKIWSDDPTEHAIYTEAKRCKTIISHYSKDWYTYANMKNAEIVEYNLTEVEK